MRTFSLLVLWSVIWSGCVGERDDMATPDSGTSVSPSSVGAGDPTCATGDCDPPTTECSFGDCDPPPQPTIGTTSNRRNVPLSLQWIDTTNTWAPFAAVGANKSGVRSTSVTGVSVSSSSIDVPYDVGDRIEGVEVYGLGDGTAGAKSAQFALSVDFGALLISVGSNTVQPASAKAVFVVPAGAGVNHTMLPGEKLQLHMVGTGSPGYVVNSVNVLYSHAGPAPITTAARPRD